MFSFYSDKTCLSARVGFLTAPFCDRFDVYVANTRSEEDMDEVTSQSIFRPVTDCDYACDSINSTEMNIKNKV